MRQRTLAIGGARACGTVAPGKPEEVGHLSAFLLFPRAGYLTGAFINIDGGTEF